MNIEELDLSVRAYNCLKRAGIDTVEKLKVLTDEDLSRIRNISKRCIEEIRQKVSAPGKTNGDRIRSMTDEELVEMFHGGGLCNYIQDNNGSFCEARAVCTNCVLEWLKQPYKEER